MPMMIKQATITERIKMMGVLALDGTVAVAVALGDAAGMEHKSDIHAEPHSMEMPPQPMLSQVIL